jgi:hypothetical protein
MTHPTNSTLYIAGSVEPSLDIACKAKNTPDIAVKGTHTPHIAAKTKLDTKCSDEECNLWVSCRDLPLLADALRSVGRKDFDDYRLLQIALRLVQGKGYRFKTKSGVYEIDPNFINKLRAYYYKLKAENPAKLEDRVFASDLNIFLTDGGQPSTEILQNNQADKSR